MRHSQKEDFLSFFGSVLCIRHPSRDESNLVGSMRAGFTFEAMKKLAVFASGSGSNAERLISYFRENGKAMVVLIVCNNPAAGVLERAKRLDVPVYLTPKNPVDDLKGLIDILKYYQIDFILLAGFLRKIPIELIQLYNRRIVNIHPALLPKYGGKGMYGMRVHEAALAAGEKKSGITIHYVNENYDEGDVIFQAECTLEKNDTPDRLAEKIHQLEHLHFPRIVALCLEK